MANPFGILPSGNAFLDRSTGEPSPRISLGSLFNRLSDEGIVDLLAFCDGPSLAQFGRTCRVAYIFSHLEGLWRELAMELHNKRHTTCRFENTWRQTYVMMLRQLRFYPGETCNGIPCGDIENITRGMASAWDLAMEKCPPIQPVKPFRVPRFYSDFLFQQWMCANYDFKKHVPGFFEDVNPVPRVSAEKLDIKEFINKYEKPNRPVVITGATKNWAALHKWTKEFLISEAGPDRRFRASAAEFSMKDYFQYAEQTCEESPMYLFDKHFSKISTLASDYSIPPYFDAKSYDDAKVSDLSSPLDDEENSSTENLARTDLFHILGEEDRPDYRWVIMGPARSGSIFHIDPNQTNAWNVCVTGRKKWIFYPPHVQPPGVRSSPDGAEVTVPISTGEWLLNFWSYHREMAKNSDPANRPMEVIVGPGEAIFVPHGYWHMVVNIDFCIALTHNYVSTSNLSDCLRFLSTKRDQVSGLRCGEAFCSSIKPEDLYERFTKALKDNFGEKMLARYLPPPTMKRKFEEQYTASIFASTRKQRRRLAEIKKEAADAAQEVRLQAEAAAERRKQEDLLAAAACADHVPDQISFSFSFF